MEVIDGSGRVIAPSFMRAAGLEPHSGQIAGQLLSRNCVSGGSIAIRGELKPLIVPIPAAAAWEDWWIAWALTQVTPVGYVDEPVYRYRRHGGNFMLGTDDDETVLDRLTEEIRFRRYMLGTVRPGTASPADLLAGVEQLRIFLETPAGRGRALEPTLELTDAQRSAARRLAADAAAVASTSLRLASFTAARAGAADPTNGAAYRVLQAVARSWDAERLGAELGPVAERLAGEDAPDILALPADRAAWLSGLTQADCVLGLAELALPGLDRFDDPGALREHVEQRWRYPLRRA
jgi:hypothetical protein